MKHLLSNMKKIYFLFFCLCFTSFLFAQKIEYKLLENIPYISTNETDNYKLERCKLDLYYPTNIKNFSTLVWFHGGGLEGGDKEIPKELKDKGFAIASVNYRLSPRATNPAYIEDAAEAIAWVFEHIKKYGGDSNLIFVAGHSAGGYLTLMVGLDKSYLAKYGIDADSIKGMIPIGGQTNTHYTIRKERGIPTDIPLVDKYAPLNNSRSGIPPILLITGQRDMEMTARYEENAHLATILKALGNKDVTLYEMQGFNHGTDLIPGYVLLENFIKKHSKKAE